LILIRVLIAVHFAVGLVSGSRIQALEDLHHLIGVHATLLWGCGDRAALLRTGGGGQGGDAGRDAPAVGVCHPNIEWFDDPARADGRTYRGREGVRKALERWLDAFEEYDFTVERYVDCGDDVLVVGVEQGRGAVSGAPVRSTNHELVTLREGMIVRFREFYDERAALEAVGLSE
jgi:ketosteroid isomerase-like protein